MIWAAATYPEGVHGEVFVDTPAGACGRGGRPTEQAELTWEPFVAHAINWAWISFNRQDVRIE
eukprot:3411170-Lingulodinium_polyedra.AAC.1